MNRYQSKVALGDDRNGKHRKRRRSILIVAGTGSILLCGMCIAGSLLPSGTSPADTPVPRTPSAGAQFQQLARSRFGSDLLSMEMSESNGMTTAIISYKVGAVWDDEGLVRRALSDVAGFLPDAFAIDGIDVVDLRVIATFEDLYGQETDETAFRFIATRAMAEKVDWDGIALKNIAIVLEREAGCEVEVHPALDSAWLGYLLE